MNDRTVEPTPAGYSSSLGKNDPRVRRSQAAQVPRVALREQKGVELGADASLADVIRLLNRLLAANTEGL